MYVYTCTIHTQLKDLHTELHSIYIQRAKSIKRLYDMICTTLKLCILCFQYNTYDCVLQNRGRYSMPTTPTPMDKANYGVMRRAIPAHIGNYIINMPQKSKTASSCSKHQISSITPQRLLIIVFNTFPMLSSSCSRPS